MLINSYLQYIMIDATLFLFSVHCRSVEWTSTAFANVILIVSYFLDFVRPFVYFKLKWYVCTATDELLGHLCFDSQYVFTLLRIGYIDQLFLSDLFSYLFHIFSILVLQQLQSSRPWDSAFIYQRNWSAKVGLAPGFHDM